jgi:predicted nucleic acid-binding protein
MILFDTNILIDLSNEDILTLQKVKELELTDSFSISIITYLELIQGCRNKHELSKLKKFLSHFEILYINENISKLSFRLMETYYLSHGLLIPDSLIAATAIIYQLQFYTKNSKDFKYIPEIQLI